VTNFKRSAKLYRLAMSYNRGLDRDKDGVACEQAWGAPSTGSPSRVPWGGGELAALRRCRAELSSATRTG